MNKALIIDFKLLEELDITINQFLFLYNLYLNDNIFEIVISEEEEKDLQNKKFVKLYHGNNELRQSAIDLIELLTIDSNSKLEEDKNIKKSDRAVNLEIKDRIQEFRGLWKGLKPGSMGSLQSCKDKLTRWMKSNPEYSFDDIIKAAKLYLSTEGMNLRFLQRADYFIYKQENNREESSRLSAFIDEIDNGYEDDWTSNLN